MLDAVEAIDFKLIPGSVTAAKAPLLSRSRRENEFCFFITPLGAD
jgi:hypothetical protein